MFRRFSGSPRWILFFDCVENLVQISERELRKSCQYSVFIIVQDSCLGVIIVHNLPTCRDQVLHRFPLSNTSDRFAEYGLHTR